MLMSEVRELVVSAFDVGHGCAYSHVLPYRTSNYIDGMAHVGMLAGAAMLARDLELVAMAETYLTTLALVGTDARTYTSGPRDGWMPSYTMPGYWYKQKPQSFAGPAAWWWSKRKGVSLGPRDPAEPVAMAKLIVALAPLYGWMLPYASALKQHLNSVMMAHLLMGKTPPKSLLWTAKDNPVYSYLYRLPCRAWYPNTGPWPAKDVPFDQTPDPDEHYTPTCQLVGMYLQEVLTR